MLPGIHLLLVLNPIKGPPPQSVTGALSTSACVGHQHRRPFWFVCLFLGSFCCFVFVFRLCFSVWPWLARNLLCGPGRPWTQEIHLLPPKCWVQRRRRVSPRPVSAFLFNLYYCLVPYTTILVLLQISVSLSFILFLPETKNLEIPTPTATTSQSFFPLKSITLNSNVATGSQSSHRIIRQLSWNSIFIDIMKHYIFTHRAESSPKEPRAFEDGQNK